MQFELFRLSLLPHKQPDMFEELGPDGQPLTRDEWIRRRFGEEIRFVHRKNFFHYIRDRSLERGGLIVGRIGREVLTAENLPPEGGLQDTERKTWRAAIIIIDPAGHGDGQKIAFEDDSAIARPYSLLSSLVSHLNDAFPSPYAVEVVPIADTETFWEFVRQNRGDITSVTFEFIAPNMFGTSDDYDAEMRDMRDKERIRRLKIQMENPNGLELETPRVKRATEEVAKGTASVKAKTRQRKRYSSKNKVKRATVPEDKLVKRPVISLISDAINLIFRP